MVALWSFARGALLLSLAVCVAWLVGGRDFWVVLLVLIYLWMD